MSEMEINEALASLEVLMSEFFAPTTNNLRKREIETMLENFSKHRDSWRHCLLFLQKSQNQYVLMFTLTTLENIINRQWVSMLTDDEKTEIRLFLWNELMAKHEVMQYFIRNKLAALMVSIARYDWPHHYPDFFSNIVELIRCSGRRCLLGLVLAQAASEELGAARDTGVLLPSARRSQLERLMLKGVPQMLAALSAILEKNAQNEGQSNPPPSPTSGVPQTSALPDLLVNAHDVHASDKALDMEIVVKCLTTLQHLFSWLPLSSHVPPSLVTTVFYWGSIATQTQSMEAALAGLGGVCELLYRRYAPPSSAATALRLQHCALRLLRHLTHPPHHMPAHHDYLNKLAEFLKLFISLHFKRLEAEPEFDAIQFLSYLFQYTFQVPVCTIFVNCLDIWIQFIDILKPEDTVKYWEALRGLVDGILNKIQFQHNKAQLQHLDNEVYDDDGETEWQTFLKHCIECIARVAELAPLDVFTCVLERWQCLAGVHARAAGRGGAAGAAAEGERLLCALLDLATLTRVLGRLAPALLADTECRGGGGGGGAGAAAAGAALVERVAAALGGAALTRPHRAAQPPAHAHAHVQVHAEMFACMGAWCCHAAACGVPAHTVEGLLAAAVPFLLPHDLPEPPLLCHAAAHLLLSLSKNVKFSADPIAQVGDLFNHAQRSLHYLEPKTGGVVREALLCLCLSRCGGAGGAGGAGAGGEAARALLAAWTAPLPLLGPAATLPPLTALLLANAHANTAAKKVIAEGVAGAAETALRMLLDGSCGAAEPELTEFFLALFTALLPQLGTFAYTAIDVFLDVAQRGGGDSGLERLVECVRLGVEAGGGGVREAAVLALLQQHALPRAAPAAPGLARAAYRLLARYTAQRLEAAAAACARRPCWRSCSSTRCPAPRPPRPASRALPTGCWPGTLHSGWRRRRRRARGGRAGAAAAARAAPRRARRARPRARCLPAAGQVHCTAAGGGGGGVREAAVLALLQQHALPRAAPAAPGLARAAYRLLARYTAQRLEAAAAACARRPCWRSCSSTRCPAPRPPRPASRALPTGCWPGTLHSGWRRRRRRARGGRAGAPAAARAAPRRARRARPRARCLPAAGQPADPPLALLLPDEVLGRGGGAAAAVPRRAGGAGPRAAAARHRAAQDQHQHAGDAQQQVEAVPQADLPRGVPGRVPVGVAGGAGGGRRARAAARRGAGGGARDGGGGLRRVPAGLPAALPARAARPAAAPPPTTGAVPAGYGSADVHPKHPASYERRELLPSVQRACGRARGDGIIAAVVRRFIGH